MEENPPTQSLQTLPIFFTFFLVIYIISYFIIFRNWTPKTRPEASSCAISLFHGTPAVIIATKALLTDPDLTFSSTNTASQNAALDFSIAYFLMDLAHYLIFLPKDFLFIGHHLATLFVLATCRYLTGHGSYAVLGLLVLAEVTSFCQNVWTLACLRKDDVEVAQRVYELLSLPFYAVYSVVRGLVGPWFVFKMGAFFVGGGGGDKVPNWAWISWMIVVVTAISVSLLWIWNLWIVFFRERRIKSNKKTR